MVWYGLVWYGLVCHGLLCNRFVWLGIINPITCCMEFGDYMQGGVLKTRQRKQAPCPPKTKKWGCIIYEYQEHIPSDQLKKN